MRSAAGSQLQALAPVLSVIRAYHPVTPVRITDGVPGSLVGDCVGDPADEPQRLEFCDHIR